MIMLAESTSCTFFVTQIFDVSGETRVFSATTRYVFYIKVIYRF